MLTFISIFPSGKTNPTPLLLKPDHCNANADWRPLWSPRSSFSSLIVSLHRDSASSSPTSAVGCPFRATNAEIISAYEPLCLPGCRHRSKQEISMTKTPSRQPPHPYAHSADSPELKQQFDAFIKELVETSLSVDALAKALSGGIDDLATVLRSLPALEGRS
jgi:hypothetical protein